MAVAELADERLRFADPDADGDVLVPVPASLRLPARLPFRLRLQDALQYRFRLLREGMAKDIAREEARGTPFFFVPVFLGLGAVVFL